MRDHIALGCAPATVPHRSLPRYWLVTQPVKTGPVTGDDAASALSGFQSSSTSLPICTSRFAVGDIA